MTHILFAIIIVVISIVGVLFSLLFTGKKLNIESIGLSMLLGPLAVTYTHFLAYQYLDVPFNLRTLFVVIAGLVLIGILLLFLHGQKLRLDIRQSTVRSFSKPAKLLIGVISLVIGFVWLQNLVWPIFEWDALTLYDFRGRILATEGMFTQDILTKYFFGYPPFTSLLHSYGYMAGVVYIKIWYAYLYTGLILTFYAWLRKDTTRMLALFGALLLAISPHILSHGLIAYTNLPYALYFSLGSLYILDWLKSDSRAALLVGSIMVAGSSWVRLTEPFWVIAILLIIAGVAWKKKEIITGVFAVFLIIFARQPWLQFRAAIHDLNTSTALNQVVNNVNKGSDSYLQYLYSVPEVIPFVAEALEKVVATFILLLLLSLMIVVKNRDYNLLRYHIVWLAAVGIILYGTFALSVSTDYWNKIPGSLTRMSIFLVIFFVAIIIKTTQLSLNESTK